MFLHGPGPWALDKYQVWTLPTSTKPKAFENSKLCWPTQFYKSVFNQLGSADEVLIQTAETSDQFNFQTIFIAPPLTNSSFKCSAAHPHWPYLQHQCFGAMTNWGDGISIHIWPLQPPVKLVRWTNEGGLLEDEQGMHWLEAPRTNNSLTTDRASSSWLDPTILSTMAHWTVKCTVCY